MLISIFDERIRGIYSQGSDEFFKLTNFYENSHEFYNNFSKKDGDKKNSRSTFCSIPCFEEKSVNNDVIAGCRVVDENGNNKDVFLTTSDVGISDFEENKRYNVPVFIEMASKPYITYPIYDFKFNVDAPVLKSSYIDDDSKSAVKTPETEIYKLNEWLKGYKESDDKVKSFVDKSQLEITALKARKNLVKKSQPIYLKYYYLNIYSYSGLDFFFYSYAPRELEIDINTAPMDNKWNIIKIQYDGAKIQQIIELHGYIFVLLKNKTVVYSLSYGDVKEGQYDITESSGQNLPIGTDNTFSAIKYINKIITIYNNGVYTISQFQPSKISFPSVDEWVTEHKGKMSLMIVKEQSYEFLYVINNQNEAWILNFHNNKWSFTDNATAHTQIRYNDDKGVYIDNLGKVSGYNEKVVGGKKYVIETGVIKLENNYNLFSVSELVLSFNSIPDSECKLLIEYKNDKEGDWIDIGGEQEIDSNHFKGGKVLHKRIKLRCRQFLLRITFTPSEKYLKPIIINDIGFRVT